MNPRKAFERFAHGLKNTHYFTLDSGQRVHFIWKGRSEPKVIEWEVAAFQNFHKLPENEQIITGENPVPDHDPRKQLLVDTVLAHRPEETFEEFLIKRGYSTQIAREREQQRLQDKAVLKEAVEQQEQGSPSSEGDLLQSYYPPRNQEELEAWIALRNAISQDPNAPVITPVGWRDVFEFSEDMGEIRQYYNTMKGLSEPLSLIGGWATIVGAGGIGFALSGATAGGLFTTALASVAIPVGAAIVAAIGLTALIGGVVAGFKKRKVESEFSEELGDINSAYKGIANWYNATHGSSVKDKKIVQQLVLDGEAVWGKGTILQKRKHMKIYRGVIRERQRAIESSLIVAYRKATDKHGYLNPHDAQNPAWEDLTKLMQELLGQPNFAVVIYDWWAEYEKGRLEKERNGKESLKKEKRQQKRLWKDKVKLLKKFFDQSSWSLAPNRKAVYYWKKITGSAPDPKASFFQGLKFPYGVPKDLPLYELLRDKGDYPLESWAGRGGEDVSILESLEAQAELVSDKGQQSIEEINSSTGTTMSTVNIKTTDGQAMKEISTNVDAHQINFDGSVLELSVDMEDSVLPQSEVGVQGAGVSGAAIPRTPPSVTTEEGIAFDKLEGGGYLIKANITFDSLQELFDKAKPYLIKSGESTVNRLSSQAYSEQPAPQIVHRFERGSVQIHTQKIDAETLGNAFVSFLQEQSRK